MKFIVLSHKLSENTPSYMASSKLTIKPVKQIKLGDSSNTFKIELDNHIGTHADCQKHFIEGGKGVAEYSIEDFIFEKVFLIELPKNKGELISEEELASFEDEISKSDFLIIKTGFQKYREEDKKAYEFEGPGFSFRAASYLASFEVLRGIGFDFISLSSPLHREEGRKAHRILLAKNKFIIVEDMNLKELRSKIKRLFVIPLFIETVDSSPCTVFAELYEQ